MLKIIWNFMHINRNFENSILMIQFFLYEKTQNKSTFKQNYYILDIIFIKWYRPLNYKNNTIKYKIMPSRNMPKPENHAA